MGNVNVQGLGAPQYTRCGSNGTCPESLLDDFAMSRPKTSFAELRAKLVIPSELLEKLPEFFFQSLLPGLGIDQCEHSNVEASHEICEEFMQNLPAALTDEAVFWPLQRLLCPAFLQTLLQLDNEFIDVTMNCLLIACMLISPIDAWIEDVLISPATADILPLGAVYIMAKQRFLATRVRGGQVVNSEVFLRHDVPWLIDLVCGPQSSQFPAHFHLSICAALSFMASASSDVCDAVAMHPTFFDVLLSLSLSGWRSGIAYLRPHLKQCWSEARIVMLMQKRTGTLFACLPQEVFRHLLGFVTEVNAPVVCQALLHEPGWGASSSCAKARLSSSTDLEAFLVDNSLLQSQLPGVAYRTKPDWGWNNSVAGRIPVEWAYWGSTVRGERKGEWVKVSNERFLPICLCSVTVLIAGSEGIPDPKDEPWKIQPQQDASPFFNSVVVNAGAMIAEDYYFLHLLYLIMLQNPRARQRFFEYGNGLSHLMMLGTDKERGPFVTNFLNNLMLLDPTCLCSCPASGHVRAVLQSRGLQMEDQADTKEEDEGRENEQNGQQGAEHIIGAQGVEWGDAIDLFARQRRSVLESAFVESDVPAEPAAHRPLYSFLACVMGAGRERPADSSCGSAGPHHCAAFTSAKTAVSCGTVGQERSGAFSSLQITQLAGLNCSFFLLNRAPLELHRFCPEVFPLEAEYEHPRSWTPFTHPGKGGGGVDMCSIL